MQTISVQQQANKQDIKHSHSNKQKKEKGKNKNQKKLRKFGNEEEGSDEIHNHKKENLNPSDGKVGSIFSNESFEKMIHNSETSN